MQTLPNSDTHAVPKLVVTTVSPILQDNQSQKTISAHEKYPSRQSDVSTPSTSHNVNPFDTDLELGSQPPRRSFFGKMSRTPKGGPDCQVWPGQDHWKQKAKAAKKNNRSCNCLSHLSKRNRIMAEILIGLLVIGIAVGVGYGISKPLGAGVWHEGR